MLIGEARKACAMSEKKKKTVPGPHYLILLPQESQEIVRVGRQSSDKDVPDCLSHALIHWSLASRGGYDGNDSLATQGVG